MLPLILAAVVTSTSADVVPTPGVALAHELRRELEEHRLRLPEALGRFVALDMPDRDACLTEWSKITRPEGAAVALHRALRVVRDRPVTRARAEGDVAERETERARDTRRTGPPAIAPAFDFDTLERIRKGSRTHAIGGGFAASGILTIIGGVVGGVVAVANDVELWPAGISIGVGGVITGIGFAIMGSGDDDFGPAGAVE